MKDAQPQSIYLQDYRVPDFLIDKTELHFSLNDEATTVTANLSIRRNPKSHQPKARLRLDGQELELVEVAIDGKALAQGNYAVNSESLTIGEVPERFVLTCVTRIKPQENTSLEGLYRSSKMYCTQCEAEGFRKITYYLDRPDVMSEFTTTIEADKTQYPLLLSNGNPIGQQTLDNNRHSVTWHDPFKKPAYLFALVAGDLSCIEDTFTTCSGRTIALKIYVEAKDIDKCNHAMQSLKNAMRWDEEVYGREYDLDIFMIVAVDDFNMGAMENKGLNIFNTSCVLAKPETTTDAGFQRVEGVVAHEYFHNWSGNRVTCRDWFQLSLKEGFTVYRDAEFSADMGSRTVKRVEDVSLLRTYQFAEDAGPMAHPVQPSSFIEISNFYTLTIYEKGAEVVRMIANLLGPEKFREGTDLYFSRHDGQAVTIQDFVAAMSHVSGRDFSQFMNWYTQAGTPAVNVSGTYDENAEEYTLEFAQSCPATPECDNKQPFVIPVALGLLGDAGTLPLQLKDAEPNTETADNTQTVIEVSGSTQRFTFTGVKEKPVPSLLRGFSAPVRLHYPYTREELSTLATKDEDGFCRWDACQQLAVAAIHDVMAQIKAGETLTLDSHLLTTFTALLADNQTDKAALALMLTLPSEAYLSEIATRIAVDTIHTARNFVANTLAHTLKDQWQHVFEQNQSFAEYSPSSADIARRSLKNTALAYLMRTEDHTVLAACMEQFKRANNMTDQLAALTAMTHTASQSSEFLAARKQCLEDFYTQWQHENLVVNLWFSVQATSPARDTLENIKTLMQHPAFEIKNPNKVRALIGTFCNQNAVNFHREDGAGYQFLKEQVLVLNKMNPQIASRLLTPFTKWKKLDETRQQLIKDKLEAILAEEISKDVYEVVSKTLK